MKKVNFTNIMWLFHELGQHLRLKIPDAPEKSDTRAMIRILVNNRPSTSNGERDPFNWLKELQSVSNYWHHLLPESEVPNDDIWRDLDTMERVAKHYGLPPEFIQNIHDIKMETWAGNYIEEDSHFEIKLRSLISEEVSQQLKSYIESPNSSVNTVAEPSTNYPNSLSQENYRGEIADCVRDFVIATYIEPARSEGQRRISVRAGDIDKALGFRYRRLPLICTTLRGKKFLEAGRIILLEESGPPSGLSTTMTFTYELKSI